MTTRRNIEMLDVHLREEYITTDEQLYQEEISTERTITLSYHAMERMKSRKISMENIIHTLNNFSWRNRSGSHMEETMTYFYVYGIHYPNKQALLIITGETINSIKVISVFRRDYSTDKYLENGMWHKRQENRPRRATRF
jgi:hypothetical protein